jgi:hypothetical protein
MELGRIEEHQNSHYGFFVNSSDSTTASRQTRWWWSQELIFRVMKILLTIQGTVLSEVL